MATINFFIQSKKSPAGIYVRFKVGRSIDAKARTKFEINPDDWSASKGQPKYFKEENLKRLYNDLLEFKSDLLNFYNNSINKRPINSDWLKEFINPPEEIKDAPQELVNYFDYYIKIKLNEISSSTIKNLKVIRKRIEAFEKNTRKKYLLKEVDFKFKIQFESFCQECNYAPNTIAKALRYIKTMCLHGRKNGIEINYQSETFNAKYQKVEIVYLTTEELDKIKNKDLKQEYLDNARDWLIISCETGQRVSDFLRFKKEMIRLQTSKKTGKKVPLIEFTQTKTGKIMTIPLSKTVMEILKKRGGEFPRQITDQRYNEYIKEVCKIAELNEVINGGLLDKDTKRKELGKFKKWQLITSHIGRRSYATNNYGKIPTSLLIAATGHSTEKQFLDYIGKSDSEKAMQLADYY
jgi:integrase